MKRLRNSLLVSLLMASACMATAQTVPPQMNFQGLLVDSADQLIEGNTNLVFRIYDQASGGTLKWGPQTNAVVVYQGQFNTVLGPTDDGGKELMDAFLSASCFLEIQVADNVPIQPRQQILSAPFALNSANSALLDGQGWNVVFDNGDPTTGKIDGAKLADGSVDTAQIAPGAVTTDRLAANVINTDTIADGGVTSADILDGTITASDIGVGAITSAGIATGAVTSADIADGTITSADLANSSVLSAHIADGTIVSGDIQDNTITTADIADNTVGSVDILDGTVTSDDIANNSVGSVDIADGSITSADIANGSVTSADIADGTITSADIANGTIQQADLGTIYRLSATDGNPLNAVYAAANGNVGIGTASPDYLLTVPGTIATDSGVYGRAGNLSLSTPAGGAITLTSGAVDFNSSSGVYIFRSTLASIGSTAVIMPNGVLARAASSRRYKENIQIAQEDFEKVLNLAPKTFNYKSQPGGPTVIGYIAEEVDEAGLDGVTIYDEEGRPDAVDYSRIVIYSNEILKKHQATIQDQQQRIDTLQSELESLKEMVQALTNHQ